jgi:methylphosphotriester-DNA--protein-cysteine methyltransferase
MLPTDHARFCELVTAALRAYVKRPTEEDLEDWWSECKGLSLDAMETAFKAHKADPDRGERAPRPADITRRMKAGARNAQNCAAMDFSGQCNYPGIFSDGTAGEGPWYCPWHRSDRIGPEASRWIEISRTTPYEVARQKRIERMTAEGQNTASVKDTAHAIAKRHGDRPWQTRMQWPTGLSTDEQTLIPNEDAA